MGNDEDVEMADSQAPDSTDAAKENANAAESLSKEEGMPEATTSDSVNETKNATESSASKTHPMQSTTTSKVASLKATFESAAQSSATGKPHVPNGKTSDQESEIARLKDSLAKEKDLRIAYEERVTSLEDEIEDLTSQLEEQEEEWRAEYERSRQQERAEMQERLLTVTEEARNQRQETANLQKQLSDMKKSVSTSTRPSTHVSDATFRDEAGVLQHEVQNWVVQNFRRVKIESSAEDLCKKLQAVTKEDQFERLRPVFEHFDTSVKLPILQAMVSCYLMSIFDEPYLFGLHGQVEWADRSRQAAESLLSILQPAAYNRCRAVTFDALRQSVSVKNLVGKSARELSETIMAGLTAVTGIEESEARLASLANIVKRAIDLAHLLRVQQAKYNIHLPAPEERYDATCMEDILEEGEEDSDRTIKFGTAPAIFKTTDEEGNELAVRNVIVNAKVLCSEAET